MLKEKNFPPFKLSVAPMMDCTDRHFRYLFRLVSQKTLLYTEMVTAPAILYGEADYHLKYNREEHPLALQLGGSDPKELSACCKRAEDYGYDEVNLNVGCPSAKVKKGGIGACLMAQPQLVAECVAKMKKATSLPITVKSRIGVDDLDSYEHLHHFIKTVAEAGCEVFIVHARKAFLKGLNPKENRTVPPLRYDRVQRVKDDFPHLSIVLNGGITTLKEIEKHLEHFDGVMVGREAYANPLLFKEVDRLFLGSASESLLKGEDEVSLGKELITRYIPYIEQELKKGQRLHLVTRHLFNLFTGVPGARGFRRYLSEQGVKKGAGIEVVHKALQYV